MCPCCCIEPGVAVEDSLAYKEFKGAMAENLVACELKRMYGNTGSKDLYYWTAEGYARAEVNFILQDDEGFIVPIEVKAGTAKRVRSMA